MIYEKADEIVEIFADENVYPEEWDFKGLNEAVFKQFNLRIHINKDNINGLEKDGLAQLILDTVKAQYDQKEIAMGAEEFRELERFVMLQTVDNLWKDHLLSMDHLKEGIGLRGYAQQHPLIVYKKEGFEMFQDLISRVKEETIGTLFRIQFAEPEAIGDIRKPKEQNFVLSHGEENAVKKQPVRRTEKKIGRNAPCPCGSGKKFKKCCGR